MGARNDDITLRLAKMVKSGFLPEVFDDEIDLLDAESKELFGADGVLTATYVRKNIPVMPNDDRIFLTDGVTWNAGRPFQHGGVVDALISTYGFIANSGTTTPMTYTRFATAEITKNGPGTVDVYHGLVNHHGPDEAGLFIGQVTTDGGGNTWGGHFLLTTTTVDAMMIGQLIEINRNVQKVDKTAVGFEVSARGNYAGDTGILISGAANWSNALVITDPVGAQIMRVEGMAQVNSHTHLNSRFIKVGNSESLKLSGDADIARVYGGGAASGVLVYGTQGGTGTAGFAQFRDNDADNNTRAEIATAAPTAGNTVLSLAYHNGTAVGYAKVTVGAPDSGGVGFRTLRIPN